MRHVIKRSLPVALGVAICLTQAFLVLTSRATAADPSEYLGRAGKHRILGGEMPPGALGQARLAGRGPVVGYFQPVAFYGPEGVAFAMSQNGIFDPPSDSLQAGLLIGGVYRFRITQIPDAPGAELYPTIEVIDRTYPPPGLATRYPIVVDIDQVDLEAALSGQLVTRVIFLEDPQTATPQRQTKTTRPPIDISDEQDALEVADRYGRPVAVVRIGSVSPPKAEVLKPAFFFGHPAWVPVLQPEPAVQP